MLRKISGVLMAKLQALLRRTYDFAAVMPVFEHRGAMLNMGEKIALTKNELSDMLSDIRDTLCVSREKCLSPS